MIASSLKNISSACASLQFEDAGSIALTLARQTQHSSGNHDDTSLITELLSAAAINLDKASKEGKSSAPVDGQLHWTLAAAINTLLLHSFDPSTASQWIQSAIENVYLPLLSSKSGLDASQREHVVQVAVAVISSHSSAWQFSLELLKTFFSSTTRDSSNTDSSTGANDQAKILELDPGMIYFSSRVIEAAAQTPTTENEQGSGSDLVLDYAAESIFPLALATLASSSTKNPTPTLAAIGQTLLPTALAAAKKIGKLSSCLTILWSTCQTLGQSTNGLSLLVQFCQPLLQHGNIVHDPALWELLLSALGSDKGLHRKRALHVLENAIAQLQEEGDDKNKQTIAAWGTFIRLYITVDDTSLHLFKEAWPDIDRLHPPAAAAARSENTSTILGLPVPWILLLWKRALQHRHLTAQKLAALSFLQRAWPEHVLAQIPPIFCSEVLIPVLGQGVMQRGEYCEEINALVDGFFHKWSNALPQKECLELLKSFLTTLSGQQQQQTMMKLTYTALIASTKTGFVFEAEEQAELVRGAVAAAAAQPGFGANAMALKIYVALLSALSKCVVIDSTEMLYLVTSFFAAIPVPLLQPGGLLCAHLVDWFSQKAHASLLPSALESLVNTYLDSLQLGSSSTVAVEEGVEEKKGLKGPSPKQIACGALILAEAIALSCSDSDGGGSSIDGSYIAEKCLDSVFSRWKAEFSTTTQISTAALPLLAALLASVKELPTTSTSAAASPRVFLKVWLSKVLSDICDALCSAVDTKYSVWLLRITQRGALENISASIEIECANRNITKDEAFNNDDVLPREFVEKRNEACNALACIAEAPAVLSGIQNLEAAAEKYAACAARFVKTCCTGYPSLFADFATVSVDKRVVLEAAIAVLRPLVACSHSMAWPSSAGSNKEGSVLIIESNDIISLASSLLDTLETAREHTPPPAPRKKSEKGRTNNKKRKSSWKLEPLTLYSWHNALSWRILEALIANDAAEESQIFPLELQGRIFAAALVGISEAPEGSNAVIPYIRCLRSMIPSLVENAQFIVPAVVTTAKTAAAAAAAAASTNCSETNDDAPSAEKQHFRDLLSRLVAAGDTATLNDVVAWMGDALLRGLNIHVRKRVGMTAAVLSCCLHPCFFKPGQHVNALHQKGGHDGTAVGAVRNIVQGFFDASTRHSRTFVLFSTQFSALLAAFPAVGAAYTDVIIELLQMGFDEETHLQSLNDAILDEPTVAELTSLLEPLDPALAKAHMASYAAPRVGSLCLLHFWVHQGLAAELKTTNSDINNSSEGSEYLIGLAAAREIWSLLFNLALTDPELSTGRYLHRGPTHRKKLRVWQALTVLCPAVPQSAVEQTLALLLEALDVANAATVKQYQEIIALKMIQNQPDLLQSMVLPLIVDYSEQRNEAIPCLMSIAAVSAFFAAKKDENDTVLEETKKKELIKRVVSIMLPWTATFVHGSRTFAQLILWRMGQVYPWLQESDASYAAFFKFFHTNADLKRLRGAMGIDFGLDNFDFQRATSPKGILCEEMCLLGTSNTTAGPLEGVPEPLMDCLAAYLAQERFALRNEIDAKMADFALQDELRRNAVVQGEEGGKTRAAAAVGALGEVTANGNGTASHDSAALNGEENRLAGDFYQRKITPSDKEAAVTDPWGAALGLASLSSNTTTQTANKGNAVVIDDFEADTLRRAVDEAVSTAQSQARQELIIVASLIDKLPNLAGLARTCEVFRASKLVLQDASITKDPTFTSISVSAEHWVPIEQVSPVVLAPWLRKKATEGYTLVGLEQTAESTRLQEFKFHEKTVLLLGAEKEGVPADLLALLDATVEIPQLGVVRSLNVHVSAAIGIYEFTRQSLAAA